MNEDFYYDDNQMYSFEKKPEELKTVLAIASFVISLVNFIFCGFMLSFISAPISIIMGIVSLVKKRGGKVFAILGIVISLISLMIFSFFTSIFIKIYPDMEYFVKNDTQIISEYNATGEIPEQFEKYRSSKYDKYWQAVQCENFDEFFGTFIKAYQQSKGINALPSNPDTPDNSDTPSTTDDGEKLVELSYKNKAGLIFKYVISA